MARKTDFQAAFAKRRTDALSRWRKAVEAHAAGRKVDLGELIDCGPMIGVQPTAIATAFAQDVAAFETAQENAERVNLSERLYREAEAAKPTPRQVQAARDALADLVQRENAPRWAAESLGQASGDAERHRRLHPRLWDDLHEYDPPAAAAALELPEPAVQPEPVAAAAAPFADGENSAWLPDDDND